MRFAELDAVTVDGFGTLVTLEDPVPGLRRALADHGVERSRAQVASAFAAEAAYYRPHAHLGRNAETLAALRRDCVGVFLEAIEVDLDAASFTPRFLEALRFEPVPGAVETLGALRRRGLALAVVANWDCALPRHLDELGLSALFAAVVTSAEAGAPKPDPAPFRLALERLGSEPARTLHVGDEPADELGARAAGLLFAPAPLDEAFEGWT
jgi:putative hydrolase of the HAD superfamily